jgi:rubredoxin
MSKSPDPLAVRCPYCGAGLRQPCVDPFGKARRAHSQRNAWARDVYRQRRRSVRRAQRARGKRFDGVKISYVCPLCGGDHPRADHEASHARSHARDAHEATEQAALDREFDRALERDGE